MKRVIFAGILMIILVGFNIFCLFEIRKAKDDISGRLDFIEYTLASGNSEETALECEKFTEYWIEKQHLLSRIVRHELLEQTTNSVAQLAPFAEYEEYGDLSAQISICRILIEEIYDSELPLFRNIF